MEDPYYSGNFEPVRSEAEKLHNKLKCLREERLTLLQQKKHKLLESCNLEITKIKTELSIINNKMEYHRLNAFVDIAKGMIEKDIYLQIWEKVGELVPEIVSTGRKSK